MNLSKLMAVLIFTSILSLLPDSSSQATDRGKSLVYRGGDQGKVVFDGKIHTAKGFSCKDCHTDFAGKGIQLFETRRKGLISSIDHENGTGCFACHNDKIAFFDCKNCHR